jgi:hypothetical protein
MAKKTEKASGGGTSLRRPGRGELGDLDHDTETEAEWKKAKEIQGRKTTAHGPGKGRKTRNKGRV